MLKSLGERSLIANAYNSKRKLLYYVDSRSGVKIPKVVYGRYGVNYLCLRYTQVMGKSYIFIGREQELVTGDGDIGR